MGKYRLLSLIHNRNRARKFLAIFTAASLVFQNGAVFFSPAFAATSLPSSIQLQQWKTKPSGQWVTGNLGSSNSDYSEGEVVPFRLNVGGVSAGSYSFSVCRDYENGSRRGYLNLRPFNTSRPASPGGTITSVLTPFDGVNVTINSINEVGGQGSCGAGERETQVGLTTTGASVAYVLWGGYLASPIDPGVGTGNGAASYPGSSLHMKLLSPSKDRSINPSAIIELATITVQKVVDSGDAIPDRWCFNISPNPNNEVLPKCPAPLTDFVTFLSLPTGSYQITETSVDNYAFASGEGINCSFDGSTAIANITAATSPINATCVFHNALSNADLTVHKNLDTDNDGQVDQTNVNTWTWDLDGGNQNFPTSATQTVSIGAHTISEDLQNGWHVVDLTCGGQSLGAITASEVNVPAQGLECVFTNARDTATITVLKDIDWDESGEIGDHPNDVSGTTDWAWDIESGEQNIPTGESRTLPTGSYTVTEDVKANFHLVSWFCTDQTGGDTNSIPVNLVSNDQQITCTLTNAPDTGSISGYKLKDADGDLATSGDQTGVFLWKISLYRCLSDFSQCNELVDYVWTSFSGYFHFNNLVPGFYRIVEEVRIGWTNLTSTFIDIVLDPGEDDQNNNFVNFKNVSITVCKYNDIDGNGQVDAQDVPMDNWMMALYKDGVPYDSQATRSSCCYNGCYTWYGLGPGSYSVEEEVKPGWSPTASPTHDFGQVSSGQTYKHDFTNRASLKICGTKYNDLDGGGDYSAGDSTIEDWEITITGDTPTRSTNTDENGHYCFENLEPGSYTLTEEDRAGWVHTSDSSVPVTLTDHDETVDFFNFKNINVTICKYVDVNGDEDITGDPLYTEAGGWEVSLNGNGQNTDGGCYTFTNVGPGNYDVTEEVKPGWTQTYPGAGSYNFDAVSGQDETFAFGNFENTSVTACKLTDSDGDLQTTADQSSKAGWTVYLSIDGVRQQPGQSTGENGCYTWTDLGPGHSYNVEEDVPSGWTNLTPTSHNFGPAQSGSETYIYTFINAELGGIVVEKQTDPDGASGHFTFTGDVTGTISDGQQLTASDLLPGVYTSTENDPTPEYDLTNIVCDDTDSTGDLLTRTATFNLQPGETITCIFTNTKRGSISGHKWNDLDGSTNWDAGEPSLDGWTVFLDEDGNKALGAGEVSTTTSGGGVYSFSNLVPGDYDVCEVLQSGWTRTLPGLGCYYLTVLPGQNLTDYDFGNFRLGEITICKYYEGEPGEEVETLVTLQIRLPFLRDALTLDLTIPDGEWGEWQNVGDPVVLRGDGDCHTFTGLLLGDYRVVEDVSVGYYNISLTISDTITVQSGTTERVVFLNARYGSIGDFVWEDRDGDKIQDPAEPGIGGVEVRLYLDGAFFATTTTDSNGWYLFANLKAGDYTVDVVGSTVPKDYKLTTANDPLSVQLDPGENELGADFGYRKEEGEILGAVLAATGASPLNLLLSLVALGMGIFLRKYSIRLRRRRVR